MNSSFFRGFLHSRCVAFTAGLSIVLAALPAFAAAPKVMVFGDSLAAAYGLAPAQGWVALLDARLKRRTPPAKLVNASISGETTRGGLSRIGADLAAHKPNLVLLELGGNDGLRGLPLRESRTNLASIIRIIRKANADVILAGACLIERIMTFFHTEGVIVSDQGVRYGLLDEQLDRLT